jgi:CRISPR system Cascade subunit CasE
MLRLAPDWLRLSAWAAGQGLLGARDEMGYAVHAALVAAFGEITPKPFRLHEWAGAAMVYAYSAEPGSALQERARRFAEPEVWQALDLDELAGKQMPDTFASGERLGFEVRARPVTRRERPGGEGFRERDVFLLACDRAGAKAAVDRAEVYAGWLKEQLERTGGARVLSCRLDALRRSTVIRRDADRRLRPAEGPDAVLSGALEVGDADRFRALLARGVGRHRAFGFGMLLLRPPGRA